MINITAAHCYNYLRSLHPQSVCGIRGNPWQTFIARVAKHTAGKETGFAYVGGGMIATPEGYKYLSPQIARIAQEFEDCQVNDFDAYDTDENGLTAGVYRRLECGAWFKEYHGREMMKVYSPDMYEKYYTRKRRKRRSRD
jgi:hypothetical protein